MKKSVMILVLAAILLSSCGTYTGSGAYVGGQFGAIIGSAIGGITDGRRGHDAGTLIGMAGGAVIGAVIGSAADRAEAERVEEYRRERQARLGTVTTTDAATAEEDGVFDPTNSGDDRILFGADSLNIRDYTLTTPPAATSGEGLILRNAQFVDANGDGILVAGEECRVSFEIMNRTGQPVYDVQPMVVELSNNKHVHISQNLHIESIMPGKGIRYTATIKGDSRLRNGTARIRVGVVFNNQEITSQSQEFTVPTRRR